MQRIIPAARTGIARIGRAALWLPPALFALMLLYGTAGMIGGAIPTNTGWVQPEMGVRIYVESNGVHTGIIVPVSAEGVDWRPLIRPEDLRDPRYAGYDHLSIGWGERTFYLETPTWADVKPSTVAAAAIGSDRTVMHVDHVSAPNVDGPNVDGDVRAIMLRPEEYRRLAAFIRATFREQDGRRPLHQFGYAGYDAFYEARGHYNAIQTCNAWTGDALRHAGVRIGAWTPFPVTVLGWFAR